MLRREAAPLYGRAVGALLGAVSPPSEPEAFVTLWPNRWQFGLGEELHTTWSAFLDVLAERRPWRGPHEHPGFSAASFSPMLRAPGNVRTVGALLGRARRGASTFAAVAAELRDVAGILFSTHDHRTHAHDFVIVIPFSRPASVTEHAHAANRWRRRFASREGTKGVLIEGLAGAFCYLPSWRPGDPWRVERTDGPFLDPTRRK